MRLTHVFKRGIIRFTTLISLFSLIMSVVPASNQVAFADLTGMGTVTLIDNDNTGPGVDGRDFSVSWDAAVANAPTSFMFYAIVIIKSSSPEPTVETGMNYEPYDGAGLMDISTNSWTGQSSQKFDSGDGVNPMAELAPGSYKACVYAFADDSLLINCSPAVDITGEEVTYTPDAGLALDAAGGGGMINTIGERRTHAFSSPVGGDYSVKVTTYNGFDSGLYVFADNAGSPGNLLYYNDDYNADPSISCVTMSLGAGENYIAAVGHASDSNMGTYTIEYMTGMCEEVVVAPPDDGGDIGGGGGAAMGLDNVNLADNDQVKAGIDGRDFSVSWNAYTPADGVFFTAYKTYLIPEAAANITVDNYNEYTQVFWTNNQLTTSWIGLSTNTVDSSSGAGVNPEVFSQGNYKACVGAFVLNELQEEVPAKFTCSMAVNITAEAGEVLGPDTKPPFIDQLPYHTALNGNGSGSAVFFAFLEDDQTTPNQFGDYNDFPDNQEYFMMFYGADVSAAPDTALSVYNTDGNLYSFAISVNSPVFAEESFEYYLAAQDRAGNVSYFCGNPSATTAEECASSPFIVNVATPGNHTISGTVKENSSGTVSNLGGANMFIGGVALNYATLSSNVSEGSNYSFDNLPGNNAYDIMAYKPGYCQNSRMEILSNTNLDGIDITLPAGECFFFGEDGESLGKPHRVFSGPPEFAGNVPLNESIRVGFDQLLDSTTIDDFDSTDAGSNVYLIDQNGTKAAGSVNFCVNVQQGGPCGNMPAGDQNVILFDPIMDLTANTFYTLVISEGVTSANGQPITGNRPSGGYELNFSTGGSGFSNEDITNNFGQGGAYMPPYVEAVIPAPGMEVARNSKILIKFNDGLEASTVTSERIKVYKGNSDIPISVSLDNNSKKMVTVTPNQNLDANSEYEIRILGGIANSRGMTLLPPDMVANTAFSSFFRSGSSTDTTPPTIYPSISNNSSDVAVNVGVLEYGFSEQLDPSTVSVENISLKRGSTTVAFTANYDPGKNTLEVIPNSVLAPSSTYTLVFGTAIADLAGNDLSQASLNSRTYTFQTSSSVDTTPPIFKEARCDDYSCMLFFNEPMKSGGPNSDTYANSVLNKQNITITEGAEDPTLNPVLLDNATITYLAGEKAVRIEGLMMTAGSKFKIALSTNIQDLSPNALALGSSYIGKIENSTETFGNFSNAGMFGPMQAGEEFKPSGFGSFTTDQFFNGDAVQAFPFVNMAGKDSNVFQVRFRPGIALQNDDQIVLSFPSGTVIANAVPDTYSPFFKDMNEAWGSGTVAFDTVYDDDGVSVDSTTNVVTAQLAISGATGADDMYTIDLKKIINPVIPKGPETGGYTVGVKVKRGSETLVSKTSMPFFTNAGGSNSITVNVYAGSQVNPVPNANGSTFVIADGPMGKTRKQITLTDGVISAVDGNAANSITYTGLPDACYSFGTDSIASLGGIDYFGQTHPDTVCVGPLNNNETKNIVLTSAELEGTSIPVTVKLTGIDSFEGKDIDIFAGGPAKFVARTLEDVNAPNANGYTLRLPSSGMWFIGVGPAMPKGTTAAIPENLPGIPPAPIDINVDLAGGTISSGFLTPPGVTVDSATKTITFAFTAADKQISGKVTDASNTAISNVEVFAHSQGFNAPAFTKTNKAGEFTLNVSNLGTYEIGTFKDGLPPFFDSVEVRPDGADAGTAVDIYFKGKQITAQNPFVIKLKKPDYSISGKVMDSSNNGIAYAPIFAKNSNGTFVPGQTDNNGNYTIFVDAGTWTVKSELPPSKSDVCGSLSKTVTITTESKSSQNITPSIGSCVTISGTVTVAGTNLANSPVFIEEWDTVNDRPAGGFFRPTITDANGLYTAKVSGNATYRVGTFHPDYGELSTTVAVEGATINDAHVNSGNTGAITVAFAGGNANMEAFIELKKSNDKHTRISKNVRGLESNVAMTVREGTYDYFINVIGLGQYTGSIQTGNTININLAATTLATISGNVDDNSGSDLSNVLITLKNNSSEVTKTATTDRNGNYSIKVPTGFTYSISASRAGYVSSSSGNIAVSADATYDFTANGTGGALTVADKTISGTVRKSDGQTAIDKGSVTAVNTSTNVAVTVPVDADGSYEIPVTDGTWAIKAVAPLHSKTTLDTNVTVAGSNQVNKNVTLSADATAVPKSVSKAIAADQGGTINDNGNTGLKLAASAGVLEAGSSNVTINVEKTYTAGDTTTALPLGDAAFSVTAQGDSTIKDLNGNVELQINYTDLIADATLPEGITEGDLKLAYFDPTKNEYVPVEGGYSIDIENNVITGQVNHFTDFVIVFPPAAGGGAEAGGGDAGGGDAGAGAGDAGAGNGGGSGGSGGGGSLIKSTLKNSETVEDSKEDSTKSSSSKKFLDIEKHWGKTYIENLYAKGIVNGYNESSFGPDKSLTRAELTKIAVNMFGLNTESVDYTELKFKDVSEKDWFAKYVVIAKNHGLIKGYDDGTFKPNAPINRAEALKILLEGAKAGLTDAEQTFSDVPTKAWYAKYVSFAVKNEIVSGYKDKTFKPQNLITRAEMAKVASVMLEKGFGPKEEEKVEEPSETLESKIPRKSVISKEVL